VFTKVHPNSFSNPDLHEELKKSGKKKVVLVGYMAHVCVSTTARAGNELGYEVIVIEDAIGDRDIPGVDAETLVKVRQTIHILIRG
jgi:nicotinamidase-related amidase